MWHLKNIRNNKNHRRTPKWASRYGLVDTSEIERKKRKSQWATRYSERLPNSTLDEQAYEEGQVPGRPAQLDENGPSSRTNTGSLWTHEEESYYGRPDHAGSSVSVKSHASAGRWHYPANFEDAEPLPGGKKKKKEKKDRWARTEDARMGVGVDEGSRKKKKKSSKATEANGDFIHPRRASYEASTVEGPEDPEARHYGSSRPEPAVNETGGGGSRDALEHEF